MNYSQKAPPSCYNLQIEEIQIAKILEELRHSTPKKKVKFSELVTKPVKKIQKRVTWGKNQLRCYTPESSDNTVELLSDSLDSCSIYKREREWVAKYCTTDGSTDESTTCSSDDDELSEEFYNNNNNDDEVNYYKEFKTKRAAVDNEYEGTNDGILQLRTLMEFLKITNARLLEMCDGESSWDYEEMGDVMYYTLKSFIATWDPSFEEDRAYLRQFMKQYDTEALRPVMISELYQCCRACKSIDEFREVMENKFNPE